MWPLYDPSMYQPPAPTNHMTPAAFASVLAELEHKPDVDSVFEAMSALRGQETLGPSGIPLRRFILHPFMIIPGLILVAMCGILVYNRAQQSPVGAGEAAVRQLSRGADPIRGGGAVFVILPALVVILIAVRASIRDKDPDMLAMRSAAAASIARMALSPKYIHEPFSSSDRVYLRKLMRRTSRDADAALEVLMSEETTAAEPDPEFRGPRTGRSNVE